LWFSSGGSDCLVPINNLDLEWALSQDVPSTISGSLEFDQKAKQISEKLNFKMPDSWKDCIENYYMLREALRTTS